MKCAQVHRSSLEVIKIQDDQGMKFQDELIAVANARGHNVRKCRFVSNAHLLLNAAGPWISDISHCGLYD